MIPPGGTGHLSVLAALASILAFVGLVQSCPPPGSRFVFRDGFLRNDTEPGLSRRWTGIKPGDGTGVYNTDGTNHYGKEWRNGLIPICLDPTFTKDEVTLFRDHIRRGMDEWYAQGLRPSSFKIDYSMTTQQCEDVGVKGPTANYLWVQRAKGDDTMAASIGNLNGGSVLMVQPESWFRPQYPYMTDAELAVQIVRTYAHELGHVFGLRHEQQNPNAWSKPRGGVGNADIFTFHCENLADYDKCLGEVKKQFDNDEAKVKKYMTDMCTSTALLLKNPCWDGDGKARDAPLLNAVQWLPVLGGAQFVQFSQEVDRKSIMIYASYGSSKGAGVSVYEINDPFGDEPVFIQPDGGYSIFQPSVLDIEGAIMMSPNPRVRTDQPPHYTPASPFYATWENQDNPFDDCHADSVTRRGMKKPNKRHEQLKRRGAEACVAMRRRLAMGSYI